MLSPAGRHFTVDVKEQSTKNIWLIQSRTPNPDHYFILVFLPKGDASPKYFVLSSDELMLRREEYKQSVLPRGRYRDDLGGINWSTGLSYESEWDSLPG